MADQRGIIFYKKNNNIFFRKHWQVNLASSEPLICSSGHPVKELWQFQALVETTPTQQHILGHIGDDSLALSRPLRRSHLKTTVTAFALYYSLVLSFFFRLFEYI